MNERPRFLAKLAEEDSAVETPSRVERALRARVAAQKETSWWVLAWPVAAAAVFAALWMFLKVPQRTAPVMASVALSAEIAKVEPMVVAPASRPVVRAVVAKRLPRVAEPVQERITRRFYSLAYASPELLANSRIMRVKVPRAALLSFGLPLSAYQAQSEKVDADVIYTEDGIARAIRFVNQE